MFSVKRRQRTSTDYNLLNVKSSTALQLQDSKDLFPKPFQCHGYCFEWGNAVALTFKAVKELFKRSCHMNHDCFFFIFWGLSSAKRQGFRSVNGRRMRTKFWDSKDLSLEMSSEGAWSYFKRLFEVAFSNFVDHTKTSDFCGRRKTTSNHVLHQKVVTKKSFSVNRWAIKFKKAALSSFSGPRRTKIAVAVEYSSSLCYGWRRRHFMA